MANNSAIRSAGSIYFHATKLGWKSSMQNGHHPNSAKFPGGVQKSTGKPISNAKNISFALILVGISGTHDIRSGYRYVDIPVALARPGLEAGKQRFTDSVERQVAAVLLEQFNLEVREAALTRAVLTECDKTPFDPVLEYFKTLDGTWDGVPRLTTWLTAYCYAANTPLNQAFAELSILQMVARVFHPGCKADSSLVLVGPQGVGKSSIARAMAMNDNWFAEMDLAVADPKKIIEQTREALVVELSEADGASKREAAHIKAILSSQRDDARLAYERATTQRKRGFVFVLTSNATGLLNDPTGARRFWPVVIPQMAKLSALRADMPQIVAEAIHVFKTQYAANPERVMLPPSLYADARALQEQHRAADPWEEEVAHLIASDGKIGAPMLEIRQDADGTTRKVIKAQTLFGRLLNGGRTTPADGRRLSSVMQSLGWEGRRSGGETVYTSPPQ